MSDDETGGRPPRYPAPDGLGDAGTALWDQVLHTEGFPYVLTPGELAILEHACHEQDVVAHLQDAAEGAETTVRGAYGQLVANPTLVELRQHRALVARLVASLKLPDHPGTKRSGESRQDVSEKARAAARARWDAVRDA